MIAEVLAGKIAGHAVATAAITIVGKIVAVVLIPTNRMHGAIICLGKGGWKCHCGAADE